MEKTSSTVAKKPAITAAKVTMAACITYVILLLALHIIKPEVTPSWQTLSIYSRGAWGWLGQITYCLLGLTHIAMFFAIKNQVKSRYGKIGLIVLLIAGFGGILGGLGVSDPLNTPQSQMTTSGSVHAIGAGLEIWGAPIAALLINLNLMRKNAAWKAKRRVLIAITAVPLLGLALFMGSGASAGGNVGPGDVIGTMNRVAIAAIMIWQIALARLVLSERN